MFYLWLTKIKCSLSETLLTTNKRSVVSQFKEKKTWFFKKTSTSIGKRYGFNSQNHVLLYFALHILLIYE